MYWEMNNIYYCSRSLNEDSSIIIDWKIIIFHAEESRESEMADLGYGDD